MSARREKQLLGPLIVREKQVNVAGEKELVFYVRTVLGESEFYKAKGGKRNKKFVGRYSVQRAACGLGLRSYVYLQGHHHAGVPQLAVHPHGEVDVQGLHGLVAEGQPVGPQVQLHRRLPRVL